METYRMNGNTVRICGKTGKAVPGCIHSAFIRTDGEYGAGREQLYEKDPWKLCQSVNRMFKERACYCLRQYRQASEIVKTLTL